ncbi:hypothetical protein BGZ60DRAFT_559197 [Tricladium varicosporioides]|nr:hypothetical protein BGZ60DRAFT_559197 [Hymenoscyphus varicosporioides]
MSTPYNNRSQSKRKSFLAFMSPISSRSSFSHSTASSTSSLQQRSGYPNLTPPPSQRERVSRFAEHFSLNPESGSERSKRKPEDKHLEPETDVGYPLSRKASATDDPAGSKASPTTKQERRKIGVYLPLGPNGKPVLSAASPIPPPPSSSRKSSRESMITSHTARSTGIMNSISEEEEEEEEEGDRGCKASTEFSSTSNAGLTCTSGRMPLRAKSAPNSPLRSRSPVRSRVRLASAFPEVSSSLLSPASSSFLGGKVVAGARSAPNLSAASHTLPRSRQKPPSTLPTLSSTSIPTSGSTSVAKGVSMGVKSTPHSRSPPRIRTRPVSTSPSSSQPRVILANSQTSSEQTRFPLPAQKMSTISTESVMSREYVRFSVPARSDSSASTPQFVAPPDLSPRVVTPKSGNGCPDDGCVTFENPDSESAINVVNVARSSKKEKRKSTWGKIKHILFDK